MRLTFLSTALLSLLVPAAASAETETLEQAWAQVYQTNPSLQAARANLRAIDEQVSQALSHWRPSIDATTQIGKNYQYIPAQKPFGTADFADTSRGYNVQLTQPLFRGFRTAAETESADRQVHAARAKLEDVEQKLFLDTATAYLDILRDQDVLDFERHNEDVLSQKLNETQERYKAGELTQTDVHQSESRLARAHVARAQAENSLMKGRAAFAHLVGTVPEQLTAPSLNPDTSKSLDDVLHLAETQNPEVVSAQYSIEAAKADIALNKGSLLPEINLVGNTGTNWGQSSSLPGREDSSQIMVQLTMPLYRSGADYSKARAAEQTVTQRRMELEDARLKARELADNSWQSLQTSQTALEADKTEVETAAKALEGVREETKIGTRTTLDELNAEQELLDAKVDQARSRHDMYLAIVQIKDAVGELTAKNLRLPVDAYDPERHYADVRGQWIGFSKNDAAYGVKPARETK